MTSRRAFINQLGKTFYGLSVMPWLSQLLPDQRSLSGSAPRPGRAEGKLGVALVGLGSYAGGQLAPALLETRECYLAGIVTGTPSKVPVWQQKYQIPDENVYHYDNFEEIAMNPAIDIVYIVLPNAMHAEYVIRAAEAGKHVICEKPMALTVGDCDRMIAACRKANKMLSIGYRLHFEPYNREMMRLGRQQVYGRVITMDSAFGFTIGDPTQWRLRKALSGGGPLQDVGIYCVQGFCYTSGLEPVAVTAVEGPKTDPVKFAEVEQSLTWEFEFPQGIRAHGAATYVENVCSLMAHAERGTFGLNPAYYYGGQAGVTPDGPMHFPQVNQQAGQMDDFALAIKAGRPSPVPGEMGRRDVRYIQAIYEAMQSGDRVPL